MRKKKKKQKKKKKEKKKRKLRKSDEILPLIVEVFQLFVFESNFLEGIDLAL